MDKLLGTLGISGLSRSKVSRMARDLDQVVAAFRPSRWTPGHTRSAGPTRSQIEVRDSGS